MAFLARALFALTLALSLFAGVMALYARDVRRNRRTTRVFATLGALLTTLTVAIGWWWL